MQTVAIFAPRKRTTDLKKPEITAESVETYFTEKEAELHKKMRYLKRQLELRGIELGAVIQARIDFRRIVGKPSRLP